MVRIIFLGGNQALTDRLKTFGKNFPCQKGEPVPLCPKTLDWVYVAGGSIAGTEQWAQYRASLAQANRYYVVACERPTSERIVSAMRDGAYDVIASEDSQERCRSAFVAAAAAQKLWWELYGAAGNPEAHGLTGRSTLMQNLRDSVQRIGPTMASVLIIGESGTGKERVAEAIHAASARKPFVTLNCAAIPADLLESELFGADKGAFTGAAQAKPGLVEAANGGTLFLDEIGELELGLQPKLLRFLETRRARRVGSTQERSFDVRIISATNRNLTQEAALGRFRLDLFYRLCEFDLRTPSLRARPEDIADLAQVFLSEASERFGRYFSTIEPELIEKFRQYNWPGNVRELRQTIERLIIHYDGPILRASWWTPPQSSPWPSPMQMQQPALWAAHPQAMQWQPQQPAFPAQEYGQSNPQIAASPATPHWQQPQPAYPAPAMPAEAAPAMPAMTAALAAPAAIQTPAMQMPTMPAAAQAHATPHTRLNKQQRFDLARDLLARSGGDLTWTAAQLGIHPTTLFRWRKSGRI